MGKATIDDVASLAGVSIKTVSRVVNREPNVRDATREKVESAIERISTTAPTFRPAISPAIAHTLSFSSTTIRAPTRRRVPATSSGCSKALFSACKTANCELLIHPCNYRNPAVGAELTALIERARPKASSSRHRCRTCPPSCPQSLQDQRAVYSAVSGQQEHS